jgi:hypothetical protein
MSNTAYTGAPVQPTATEDAHTIMVNSISWAAIFAGVVVGLVTQLLLTMLGTGIGLATIDASAANNPSASGFSIVSGIWFILSGLIASFVGGYVAARMSGRTVATTGAMHGLTTWAFTTLLILWLLTTSVGSIVGGALGGVANAVGTLGDTLAQSAAPALQNADPAAFIDRQVRGTGESPEALQAEASNAIRQLVLTGQAPDANAKQRAVDALARAANIPPDQAQQRVDEIVNQFNQTRERVVNAASETADKAASVVSTGALIAFAALVLGAIAGWFGGRSGVVHPVIADRLARNRVARM